MSKKATEATPRKRVKKAVPETAPAAAPSNPPESPTSGLPPDDPAPGAATVPPVLAEKPAKAPKHVPGLVRLTRNPYNDDGKLQSPPYTADVPRSEVQNWLDSGKGWNEE